MSGRLSNKTHRLHVERSFWQSSGAAREDAKVRQAAKKDKKEGGTGEISSIIPNRHKLRQRGFLRGNRFVKVAGVLLPATHHVAAHATKTPASLRTHVQVIQWKLVNGTYKKVKFLIPLDKFQREEPNAGS